jgi:hypothetical protein
MVYDLAEKLYSQRYFSSYLMNRIKGTIEDGEREDVMKDVKGFVENANKNMKRYPAETGRMCLALFDEIESANSIDHRKIDVNLVCEYSISLFGKVMIGKIAPMWFVDDSEELHSYIMNEA